MARLVAFLVALSLPSSVLAQDAVTVVRVWDVTWQTASTSDGSVIRVPVLRWAESQPPRTGSRYTAPPEIDAVVRVEDRLRTAQRAQDARTVTEILSEQYFETDVNGVGRDKAATIRLLSQTASASAASGTMTARAAENAVVLTGEETGGTPDRRLFTHVYVRGSGHAWKLLSSTTVPTRR
jgi:hypothetical protein